MSDDNRVDTGTVLTRLRKPIRGNLQVKCPRCGEEINVGALIGSVSTPKKAAAARENAKLGGWPKGKPRKKKKRSSANGELSDGAKPRSLQ